MTEGQQQRLFAQLVARLILRAAEMGYEVTLGEAYRTPEQAALNAAKGSGIVHSLHCRRLAIDLNLFRAGVYLTDTESYRPLGMWWLEQHELNRWGGNFSKLQDGNHFSMTRGGFA